jgi:hypothetical protein
MGQQETGLIAFFDILGYQNIIDNNDISEVAQLIDNLLVDLPNKAKEKSKWFGEGIPKEEDVLSDLYTMVISDSIIIAKPMPKTFSEDWGFTYLTWVFGKYCESLLDFAFENGLPLRGAIDYGEYYLNRNCFAGKPIIDCYRMSHMLNFSGCILTPTLSDRYHSIKNKETLRYYSENLGFPYLCPLKDNKNQRFFTICWCEKVTQINDLREYVFKSFSKHYKDVSGSTITKLDETELWLRKRKIWAEQ